MSSLSLSNNCRSVEVWKCGNVEICLHCLCLITLEAKTVLIKAGINLRRSDIQRSEKKEFAKYQLGPFNVG